DGARRTIASVHNRRVHLVGTLEGIDRAPAGIEAGIVLQRARGAFDRVERAAAGGEDRRSGVERAAEAVAIHTILLGGEQSPLDHAGAAVDRELPVSHD